MIRSAIKRWGFRRKKEPPSRLEKSGPIMLGVKVIVLLRSCKGEGNYEDVIATPFSVLFSPIYFDLTDDASVWWVTSTLNLLSNP